MATFNKFRNSFPESSNEKGERFEIFLSEWMFKHHPALSSQFKKVWRFSEWPGAWSQKDLGTDLIAEDQHGKICAIQAKFYKEKNSIPKSHIDSFLSDSNREGVDYRLLIATTDNLGPNARKTIEGQEKEVQTFLLHHFLEPFEWPESIDSLEAYEPRQPHQPFPHQQAAIDDVCAKIQGRGQLLMACGTGKTLTGQRITDTLDSETTLVLLPSLLLLSKTVADWVSEKEKDFIYLPVCSDKSATKKTDEISLNNSELCFRSTTDPTEIARFLKRPERKVVFSTYQSSPQIAEAFKTESLKPFDLIIADEAHRCAGKVSSDYSTVLSEDLIPAKKRLFMTATPRTYSSRLKQNAMDADVQVASMDDEQVFGPVLHHLTFGQAIENDPPLLTDYRVVVVGVNDALVLEQVEERAFVRTEGGLENDARSLAIQIGLSKAIKDFDLKRVISFHGRVNYASDFAASFLKLQEDLKPESKAEGVTTYGYVSGAMPTSQRTRELRALGKLANEDRYIVGNARCLSEGVDVPALDGVAFVDPKRSEIDIVQAVGRAIRLSEGKDIGTIVIPVFLSDSDDPDEVLSGSEFDQVWKVVNALRSHDETLGESLDQLRIKLGRKQQISLKASKIVFDVPREISQEFIEAFETKLIETTTGAWEFWFGLLLDYKAEFGDCLVPQKFVYQGANLGIWVTSQRKKKERLTPERIKRLNDLGFVWDPLTQQWERHFKALAGYKAEFGDCLVPQTFVYEGIQLGTWVANQRSKKETLTPERIQRLNDLGFVWDALTQQWEEHFKALVAYKAEFGDCLVPKTLIYRGLNLGSWVNTLRSVKDKLTPERRQRLNDLGFVWDANIYTWEKNFEALVAYKAEFGDCLVPDGFQYHGVSLGVWVSKQRSKKENLTPERIQRLNDLGFVWDIKAYYWEKNFEALVAYKAEFGDCLVPQRFVYLGFNLGSWVANQRAEKKTLTPEKIQRLNDLGFVWNSKDHSWEEHFKALAAYKAEFGDCLVPQDFIFQGLKLGRWGSKQRSKKETLIPERIERLNDLGFVWDAKSHIFEENFKALVAYKAEFGDCLVPKTLIYRGLNLGSWVNTLRSVKDKLTPERRQRLNDLGFVWDANIYTWEKNFEALVAYKAEFGDCLVPQKFIYRGLKLGSWVNIQRGIKDKLTPERRQRLNDLGFVWDPLTHQWEKNFKALVAYKAEFGDCLVPKTLIYRGLNLGSWVNTLRSVKDKLTPERRQRLNDLGFVWDANIYTWEKNFEALVAYKAEFGDCLVPQKFIYLGLKLGIWVSTQRSKKETLTPERIQRLNDLGFAWTARE